MMLSVLVTLLANEVKEFALVGNYFELRTAPAVVDQVELLDRSGGVVAILDDVEATDKVKTSRKFETVRVTNGGTAQTVRMYYGEGESGSNRFTGVVSGEVSLNAATLAALETIGLDVATLNALNRPEAATGYFSSAEAVGSNVAQLALAPALNVGGVIVLSASMTVGQDGGGIARGGLIAKSSAPASVTDGEILAQLMPGAVGQTSSAPTYASYAGFQVHAPIMVPAGLGLYFITNEVLTTGTQRAVRYRLL